MKKGRKFTGEPFRYVVSSGNAVVVTGYVDQNEDVYFDCAWEHDPTAIDQKQAQDELKIAVQRVIIDGILRPQNRNDQ